MRQVQVLVSAKDVEIRVFSLAGLYCQEVEQLFLSKVRPGFSLSGEDPAINVRGPERAYRDSFFVLTSTWRARIFAFRS